MRTLGPLKLSLLIKGAAQHMQRSRFSLKGPGFESLLCRDFYLLLSQWTVETKPIQCLCKRFHLCSYRQRTEERKFVNKIFFPGMFEGFFRGVQTPAPHQRGPRRSEGSRLRHLRQRLCQSRQTFPARARSRPQVRQTCRVGPDSGKWLSDSKLVAGKPFLPNLNYFEPVQPQAAQLGIHF